jgi:hypothetical protein
MHFPWNGMETELDSESCPSPARVDGGVCVAVGAQATSILSAALGRMLILLGSGSVVDMVLGAAGR